MEFYDTDQLSNDIAKRSYTATLLRLNPNGNSPILALSGAAKTKKATGIGHTYWTQTAEYTTVVLTVAISTANQTTLTASAADVAKLIPNMILRYQDPTDHSLYEHMLITSIDSATTFTVVRGFSESTPLTSVAIGEVLVDIGSAFEQGSLPPVPRSMGFVPATNFTQIFRTAYGLSKTLAASQVDVGEGNVAESKRDAMFYHGIDLERSILFGKKSPQNLGDKAAVSMVFNGRPMTTMDGIESSIRNYAPTNLHQAGATTTFDQLETMVDPLFDYKTNMMDTNTRTIYCGKQALKVFNRLGKADSQNTSTVQTTKYGQRFRQFSTTRGDFNIVEHPILNTNNVWAKMAFVMDLSSFDLRWLRPTSTEPIKGTGRDEEAGVMTSELTLEFGNPFACAVIYGLTDAA